MEVRRTAPVKLVVSDEQRDALHETREQFLWCANRASEFCWDKYDYDDCITDKRKAQNALYDELREHTDDLHANLVIGAI
jgi:putative transposase